MQGKLRSSQQCAASWRIVNSSDRQASYFESLLLILLPFTKAIAHLAGRGVVIPVWALNWYISIRRGLVPRRGVVDLNLMQANDHDCVSYPDPYVKVFSSFILLGVGGYSRWLGSVQKGLIEAGRLLRRSGSGRLLLELDLHECGDLNSRTLKNITR